MTIELLYWPGCPSHPKALADLRAALAALGRDPDAVVVRAVETEAEAAEERFSGSPTFRAGGRDLFPSDDPPALNCRIYRRPSGQVSPTPDPDELRAALRSALEDAA